MKKVETHHLTHNPSAAWQEISQSQKVIKVKVKTPYNAIPENKVRIVCMSDTHSLTHQIKFDIPDGDIFIHAGDFTKCGQIDEVEEFSRWLETLPHKHKIVIAGNHELSFDPTFTKQFHKNNGPKGKCCNLFDTCIPTLGMPKETLTEAATTSNIKEHLKNCIYLEDSGIELYGLKFYGSPWQPEFCKWAFNLPRGDPCLTKWNAIPDDTDILITHGPPVGHGDLVCSGIRAGCVELLATVQQRVKPKYHVFGHIHEGYGITSDGKIIFINASTCNINYIPSNPPVVVDVALPEGFSK